MMRDHGVTYPLGNKSPSIMAGMWGERNIWSQVPKSLINKEGQQQSQKTNKNSRARKGVWPKPQERGS